MPEIAPGRFVRFQKSAHITSGPNAAPKPAQANETMPNTELSGFLAITTPSIAIITTVILAASILFFSEILSPKVSRNMFSDTLDAAAKSCESAVDIVLARIPAKIRPAISAGKTPWVERSPATRTITVSVPKKEKSNTDLSITHSIPIHSPNPLPFGGDAARANGNASAAEERKRKERNDAYRVYEEIIKDNIDYDILLQDKRIDKDRLNEIVDLILETVCTARKQIRIAGDDYPAELVKAKFMKLNSSHIEFVLDCMQENTTKIRNIKQYLKAVLFNAPSTIDSYYTALVAHDMASGKLYGNQKSGIPDYSCSEYETL